MPRNICQLTTNEHFPSLCHSSIHKYPHTYTYVHTKVFAAYHVFTDQLTLACDRKPATKTETRGSQQRNQDCSLRAGNGKFRTLHIPVHLASRSTFKNENIPGSVRAGKASAVDDESGSTQATCLMHMPLPSQTRAYASKRTTGSLCFVTAAVHICSRSAIYC